MPVLILQPKTNTWSRPLAGNIGFRADVCTDLAFPRRRGNCKSLWGRL